MTIGRERYGNMEPPHVRRGLLAVGLTLVVAAIPLILLLGSLAVIVSTVGGLFLIYAFLPSSYPMLGVVGTVALTSVTFGIGRWLLED
ncbi:MAG: hypothetical protein WAT66_09405 [Actinomycetota bacterium]